MAEPTAPECRAVLVCPVCPGLAVIDVYRGPARCYGPVEAPHPPVFMVPERLA